MAAFSVVFFGPVGSILGGLFGNIFGKLFGGLFGGKPPRTKLNASGTFGGLSLGPDGLEFGDFGVNARARGTGAGKFGGVGEQVEGIANDAMRTIVDTLNLLPRQILEKFQLSELSQAIADATSISINSRSKHFERVLHDYLVTVPARLMNAVQPLFVQGLEGSLSRLGFGGLAGGAGSLIQAVTPPMGIVGANDPLLEQFKEGIEGLNGLFEILNKLEPVLKFSTQAEKALIETGLGRLLESGSGADLKAAAERFIKNFQEEFQASEARRQLGFGLAEALVAGFNQIDARSAFSQFQKGFADVIKQTMQQAIVESFVMKNLLPLLVGPLAGITDILGGIGQGKTAGQALAEAQPLINSLGKSIQGLEPIFLALIELVRKLDTRIEMSLGVKGSGGNTININITGSSGGEADAREIAERIGRLFEATLSPQ